LSVQKFDSPTFGVFRPLKKGAQLAPRRAGVQQVKMGGRILSALAIASLALPAGAGQRQRSFQVGAIVVRSAHIQAVVSASGSSWLLLAGSTAVAVQIDSGAAQLAAAPEVELPPGTAMVTVQY
jgi:hypothetical protein